MKKELLSRSGKIRYRPLVFIGCPGHYVGDDGTIWSRIKTRGEKGKCGITSYISNNWRKLKVYVRKDGYCFVVISYKNKQKTSSVHRLVLEAFVGPCPEGMEACHYPDRNPRNNRLENLRWDTRSENAKDSVKHGTANFLRKEINQGIKASTAKLTDEKVRDIRKMFEAGGISMRRIGRKYGVYHATIRRIVRGFGWTHVK